MTQIKMALPHRVLLVDDDRHVREMMTGALAKKGFEVVPATGAIEALSLISTQTFDVLIADLHLPDPSDGFEVISKMRHRQPDSLTLLVCGYPDVRSSMDVLFLEADDIIVRPFEVGRLAECVQKRMRTRKPTANMQKEQLASILQHSARRIVEEWLDRVGTNNDLKHVELTNQERTGHVSRIIEDLIIRLREPRITLEETKPTCSVAAIAHGEMRRRQGYTPVMLIHESQILRGTIFRILQGNLTPLEFGLVFQAVVTIADELDSQLIRSMDSYMSVINQPVEAHPMSEMCI